MTSTKIRYVVYRARTKYNKKVLVIEADADNIGGTCVNVGCVPKKVRRGFHTIVSGNEGG